MHAIMPRYARLHHIRERVHFIALPVRLLRRLAQVAAVRVALVLLGHELLRSCSAHIRRVLGETSHVMVTQDRIIHVL